MHPMNDPINEQLSEPAMHMVTSVDGRTMTVTLSGDIDSTTAYQPYEEVVAAFEAGPLDLVVVDVAGVGFTDSTALGTLIRINRHAAEHGARCEIRNVPDRLHRLLAMTGLDRDLILT